MKSRLYNVTKYFGFLTVFISWTCMITITIVHSPNWHEPISQYGYYQDTYRYFAISLIFAAITWYLFSIHLNTYWRYSSLVTLFAGVLFIVIGLVPYRPGVKTFIIDTHNVAVLFAAILYMLPIAFIGYTKRHQNIAKLSKALFYTTILLLSLSVTSRIFDKGVIYAQGLALLPVNIWLITVNVLVLKHRKEVSTEKQQLL